MLRTLPHGEARALDTACSAVCGGGAPSRRAGQPHGRDPLREVPATDIQHTNLSLLSRFVSDAGAILPRKLTGVKRKKQRLLTKALKRAHILALLPRTWKHPRYRHVSYADQYSKAERIPPPRMDDDFRDPPDIRFPNRWEPKVRPNVGLPGLSRATPPSASS